MLMTCMHQCSRLLYLGVKNKNRKKKIKLSKEDIAELAEFFWLLFKADLKNKRKN